MTPFFLPSTETGKKIQAATRIDTVFFRRALKIGKIVSYRISTTAEIGGTEIASSLTSRPLNGLHNICMRRELVLNETIGPALQLADITPKKPRSTGDAEE